MNYTFPVITHIDDVLPHIEGRAEFIVAKKNGYTVINYVVTKSDTFDMAGPDDFGGSIRRECRGLIFDVHGHLISRPFHKFFNVGEREETQSKSINIDKPHTVMEKMDGSMVRPLIVDGYLRLGTKMGITDVAMQAEEWLAAQDVSLKKWLRKCVEDSMTPIFEWVSPFNQIVLAYEKADLVYLGTRDNTTGEYTMDKGCPFNTVPQHASVRQEVTGYLNSVQKCENYEGDIIRFDDGHMVKIKCDWYVRIHKTIERIVYDRNIVNLILNKNIDDVIPTLPQYQIKRVRDFETRFWVGFDKTEKRLIDQFRDAVDVCGKDRKKIALEYVPNLKDRAEAQFIFRMLDGHSLPDLLQDHICKNINSNTKWKKCADLMEI